MTDRDKLKELLKQAQDKYCDICAECAEDGYKDHESFEDFFADYLLANGVIVPPCKVGDVVYYPYEYGNKVLEKTVIKIVIEKEDRWLDVGVSFLPFENIGKTVFLTKEEAEEKLKELNK